MSGAYRNTAAGEATNAAELFDVAAACRQVRDRASLSAVVERSGVKLTRRGGEWKGCCPFHPDRSPSFSVYADDKRFMCFGCGAEGDTLDFVQRAHGLSLIEAIRMVDAGDLPVIQRCERPVAATNDRGQEALAIWRAANDAAGTPAEAYLRRRGIHIPLPPSLRFARLRYGSRGNLHPTLVAAVMSPAGVVEGIQRTYLTEDGQKASMKPVKLSLGRVRGNAIQLAPAGADLIVTEGLEDGLTLFQEVGVPVWVSAGTSMMPAMRLDSTVQTITIGGDNDAAGATAVKKAGDAFSRAGRQVRTMWPAKGFKDFNAELTGAGW